MSITNNFSNNIEELMKVKVLKASNTNGLKQSVLKIIDKEQLKRKFNRYETLNALNAVERNSFYIEEKGKIVKCYKYRAYREVRDGDVNRKYNIRVDNTKMLLYLK